MPHLITSAILPSLQVNLNGVIHLEGIGVADGANIMGHPIKHSSCTPKDPPHFAQPVLGLCRHDPMNSKAALGVIDQMEVLPGLVNADYILKASRVGYLSLDFVTYLNKVLHANLSFISC